MKISLFPLDVVLFPGAPLPLHIFEERYKKMIGECLEQNTAFGVVRAQQDGLAVIGCMARIVRVMQRYDDGRLDILCQGEQRFEIEMLDSSLEYLQADVLLVEDEGGPATREQREQCAALHFETMALAGMEMEAAHLSLDEPISFQLASALPADLGFKQQILSLRSDAERTSHLLQFYEAVLPKLRGSAAAQQGSKKNGRVM
ncbi:LON peptidase substrate-binding domain-containing protein [Silvibacterium sp.]|uniref:LON peptidase substrate-binding domain-containing protein n=1 Tax=Silvibacterium sp. TaxID=1964179 RepID=UPI0039E34DAF